MGQKQTEEMRKKLTETLKVQYELKLVEIVQTNKLYI